MEREGEEEELRVEGKCMGGKGVVGGRLREENGEVRKGNEET